MCQHGDANSSTNWRYRRVPFNESAWECWGLKKTYILREIPKTRFMDSGLLYENDEEECVLWMRSAWQTLASLCLFTCIVYVSKYWVPIALLRQNKPIWLLYLGHAQIIKEFSASKMKLMCSFPFPSMRQLINVTKNFRRDLHVKHKKSRVMTYFPISKSCDARFFRGKLVQPTRSTTQSSLVASGACLGTSAVFSGQQTQTINIIKLSIHFFCFLRSIFWRNKIYCHRVLFKK